MTRYLPNLKKISICVTTLILSDLGLYHMINNRFVNFFNGLIPVDFNENFVMIIIMETIWLMPYFYFYIKSLNEITKYYVECASYYMIKTHSVDKLFYYVYLRLTIEVVLINVIAVIIGMIFGYSCSIIELVGNIFRMTLAVSIMMGVGLCKKNVSEYAIMMFSGLYILSIISNANKHINELTCLFLNYGNTWLLELLILIFIIFANITIIQLYKRVDL